MSTVAQTQTGPLLSASETVARTNSGYDVLSQLGVGTDGTALLARDRSSDARVLLYFLTRVDRESERWRSLRERLQALALLEHPSVLHVLDLEEEASVPRVVLEFASETSVGDAIGAGPQPPAETLELVLRAAQALSAAHSLGLHHGALTPFLVQLSEGNVPALDLSGLAVCSVAPGLDSVSSAYAAPELGREATGPDSDVWGLGAMGLALCLGRHPSKGDLARAGTLVSGPLGALFDLMLEPDRDKRPPMAEVVRRLRALGTEQRRTIPPGAAAMPPEERGPGEVSAGMRLGRFQLLRKLGEGGMGSVFEGMDLASGATVAVKVLHPELTARPELLERFKREGRILAEVRSPYVANLLEVNQDRGVHFLAMEFVQGPTLDRYAQERGRLEERLALELCGEVCRALEGAHRRGIVHRDLKPENVMLTAEALGPAGKGPRVKLCDFGIARDVTDGRKTGENVKLTTEGSVVGTPLFMSPEQCRGAPLTPAADVYALGVMLFVLLTGRAPFESEQSMELMVMHAQQPPPPVRELAPEVSEPTAALVARALEKDPSRRFADAAELLDALERLLRGEPSAIAVHPALPKTASAKTVTLQWSWDLDAAPAALWPAVSDTDRLNRALGNPPPEYKVQRGADGTLERSARFSLRGIALAWRELPYEWVEGRRWGVFREYERGPLRWLSTELDLAPREGGGSRLTWTFRFEARSVLHRWLAWVDMSLLQKPALGRLFARLDEAVRKGARGAAAGDAYAVDHGLAPRGEGLLSAAEEKLRAAGCDARAVDTLAGLLRNGSEAELARVRPLAVAQRAGVEEEAFVEVCLRASREGLLVMLWDVLCPLCRVPASFAETLRSIEEHAHCDACALDYRVDFARSIELFFRAAPSVREVETKVFCAAGPYHAPHVVAQVRLGAGERFVLSVGLEPGRYRLRSPQLPYALELRVSDRTRAAHLELPVGPALAQYREVLELAPGAQQLALTSELEVEVVLRLERAASREDALTAARASALPLFRELFPGEVLKPGQLVSVANVTLLTTAVPDARALLQKLGDAQGFELILRHLRALAECVDEESGQVLKTVGAGLVAAFEDPLRAVRAALAMHARLRADPGTAALGLRVAVHQGPALAATLNDRVDYFGRNAELALDLLSVPREPAVVLSRSVAEDVDVAVAVWGKGLSPEVVSLDALEPALWAAVLDAGQLRARSPRVTQGAA